MQPARGHGRISYGMRVDHLASLVLPSVAFLRNALSKTLLLLLMRMRRFQEWQPCFKTGLFDFPSGTVRSVRMNDHLLGGRVDDYVQFFKWNEAEHNFVHTGQDESANAGTPVSETNVNGTDNVTFATKPSAGLAIICSWIAAMGYKKNAGERTRTSTPCGTIS